MLTHHVISSGLMSLFFFSISINATKNGEPTSSHLTSGLHLSPSALEYNQKNAKIPVDFAKVKLEIGDKLANHHATSLARPQEKSETASRQEMPSLNFQASGNIEYKNQKIHHSGSMVGYHHHVEAIHDQRHPSRLFDLHPVYDHPDNAAHVVKKFTQAKDSNRIDQERFDALMFAHNEKARAVNHVKNGGVLQGVTGSLIYPENMNRIHAHAISQHGTTGKLRLVSEGLKYRNVQFEPAPEGSIEKNKDIMANSPGKQDFPGPRSPPRRSKSPVAVDRPPHQPPIRLNVEQASPSEHAGHLDKAPVQVPNHAPTQSSPRSLSPKASNNPPIIEPAKVDKASPFLPYDVTKAELKFGRVHLLQGSLVKYREKMEQKLSPSHPALAYNLHPIHDHPANADHHDSKLLLEMLDRKITEAQHNTHSHNAEEKKKARQFIDAGGVVHSLNNELIHQADLDRHHVYDLHQQELTARLALLKSKEGETIRRLKFMPPDNKKRKRVPEENFQHSTDSTQLLPSSSSRPPRNIWESGLTSKDDIVVPSHLPPSYSSKVTRYQRKDNKLEVNSIFHHRKEVEENLPKDHLEHMLGIDVVRDHGSNLELRKKQLGEDRKLGKIDDVEYQRELINAEMKAKLLHVVDQGGFARGAMGEIHHHRDLHPVKVYQQMSKLDANSIPRLIIKPSYHKGEAIYHLRWKDGKISKASQEALMSHQQKNDTLEHLKSTTNPQTHAHLFNPGASNINSILRQGNQKVPLSEQPIPRKSIQFEPNVRPGDKLGGAKLGGKGKNTNSREAGRGRGRGQNSNAQHKNIEHFQATVVPPRTPDL